MLHSRTTGLGMGSFPAGASGPMNSRQNLRGIASMLVATGTFVANDSCMKLVMADAPPLQVLAMRGIAACLWCLPLLLVFGYGRQLPHALNRWVVLRSTFECVAIVAFVFALPRMAIADITAIAQISPLACTRWRLGLVGRAYRAGTMAVHRIGHCRRAARRAARFVRRLALCGARLRDRGGGSTARHHLAKGRVCHSGARGNLQHAGHGDAVRDWLARSFSKTLYGQRQPIWC